MNTDKLIDFLSTNVEPIQPGRLGKVLLLALVAGGAAALCLMLVTVGPRSNLGNASQIGFLALRLIFTLSLIATGSLFLAKLMRPGRRTRGSWSAVILTFVALGIAGVSGLVSASGWKPVTLGTHWATCMYCIPLFAVLPYLALIWALRQGAPTRLKLTGGIAGIVAGALGAAAYAFHCPDDFLPFIAIWYTAAIAFVACIGAWLGPRLLRW